MKKILMLNPVLDIGGAEKVLMDIVLTLKDKYSFSVVAKQGYYSSLLTEKRIRQFSLPQIKKNNIILLIKLYLNIYRIIKEEQPGIVHTHHRMLSFIVGMIPLKSFVHIHTMHCLFNDKKILTRLVKPHHTVAVGENVFKSIVKNFKYPAQKCSIIKNGIKQDKYKRFYASQIHRISCIGRLDEIKGQIYLLRAVAQLKNMNLIVQFIGDGPQREVLEKETKKLSISSFVVFLGFRHDINQILLNSDLVVSPSLSEGLPLVPIEALSCAVPIVATDIEGNNEVIINNKTGLLVPPGDAKALADAIIWANRNMSQMIKYAQTGYSYVKNVYPIENMIDQYDQLYAKYYP
jgi:glycosyltransferase involved in cell wall biosynthesis